MNNLQIIKKKEGKLIGHIWRRNDLLKHVTGGKTEGRIEMTGRRGGKCQQQMDDLKEMRGCWNLEQEALDHTLWRTGFERGHGPAVRQTTE